MMPISPLCPSLTSSTPPTVRTMSTMKSGAFICGVVMHTACDSRSRHSSWFSLWLLALLGKGCECTIIRVGSLWQCTKNVVPAKYCMKTTLNNTAINCLLFIMQLISEIRYWLLTIFSSALQSFRRGRLPCIHCRQPWLSVRRALYCRLCLSSSVPPPQSSPSFVAVSRWR